MTAYEFWMPLALLALAGLYTLYVRHEGKLLDLRIEEARRKRQHPAE